MFPWIDPQIFWRVVELTVWAVLNNTWPPRVGQGAEIISLGLSRTWYFIRRPTSSSPQQIFKRPPSKDHIQCHRSRVGGRKKTTSCAGRAYFYLASRAPWIINCIANCLNNNRGTSRYDFTNLQWNKITRRLHEMLMITVQM